MVFPQSIRAQQPLGVDAFNPVRTEPFILYTVMYSRGPKANPEGELVAGGSVLVKNRMVFLVTETDRS
jgi:hypothetical protein